MASGGSVTLTTAHRLDIESTGNISGVDFTITGTDENDDTLSEVITGPNNATVTTTNYFKTITQVAVDGAVGTNTSVGTTDEATSNHIPFNWRSREFQIGLFVTVTGTINYTIQHTPDNLLAGQSPTWFDHDILASQTASDDSNYVLPVLGTRIILNSYTAAATLVWDIISGG